MKFASVRGESPAVDFKTALFAGLAPDGALYVPEHLPAVSPDASSDDSLHSIAYAILSRFIDEIPEKDLRSIIAKAMTFPIPLVPLKDKLFLLELYHGPTLAFKDVGARFMAEAMGYFLQKERREVTIVVATSGDTGSAVAHGFHNVPNITVYILYPSGKISRLQEQQMTTLGGNIRAVEVEGTFDDCQLLVKQSLADQELLTTLHLTTANSINLGRLLPQITYYFWALAQLGRMTSDRPWVVVPSGNFGNITAAVYAQWMGAPIDRCIAATNVNDVFCQYLETGMFTPRASVQTLSNAMDVGNPSNLARLQFLYGNDAKALRQHVNAASITDAETLNEISRTYETTGYILDPHTAVGVAVARRVRAGFGGPIIIPATAHPAKFPETVERAIGRRIPLPLSLELSLGRTKQAGQLGPEFSGWKKMLLQDSGM